jgi:murein DD-endopeptidase MepM/ murein hydrolase activator NlpD
MARYSEGGHTFATDLFAPEGTSYVAVTSGVVDFVRYTDTWDPALGDMSLAGGLCVAIIGDDGVRYYGSHLSAIEPGIAPGVRVSAGQTLGYVGHTGNAANTPPHVHFGISAPTYPEDWLARRGQVNPIPFLDAWQQGFAITPPLPQP